MTALFPRHARAMLAAVAMLTVLGTTIETRAGEVIFTEDALIACDDLRFEGLDVTVDGAVLTVDCFHSFASLTVINGGAVTHTAGIREGLDLLILGDASVEAGSSIAVSGRGFGPGLGPGRGEDCAGLGCGGGGGGHGGRGGRGRGADGGAGYGSVEDPADLGSGGGGDRDETGGAGGGAIRMRVTGTFHVDGDVLANGADAPNADTGGGAGGSIFVATNALSGGGVIDASGGDGRGRGGGGGGGRVAVLADLATTYTGIVAAVGGAPGHLYAEAGGAGTVFLLTVANSYGDLILDNDGRSGATTDLSGDPTFENVWVRGGAVMSHPAAEAGFHLFVVDELNVAVSGRISAAGRGFPTSEGPGAGGDSDWYGGGGAGHGGRGGNGAGGVGGPPYGSAEQPTDLGSGGGRAQSTDGGNGGGAMRFSVGGTLAVWGVIDADGDDGQGLTGGGSGGSLFIETTRLDGDGPIRAKGGIGYVLAGGGAGGRIAVYTDVSTHTGHVRARGGVGFHPGERGTVVLDDLQGELDFEEPVRVGDAADPSAVGSIDLDGRNGNDVAVPVRGDESGDTPGQVLVLLNDGTGVGYERVLTDVGTDPSAIAWGEFDGVNGPDLAVTNATDGTVTILLNDGLQQGTFIEPAQTVGVGAMPAAISKGFIDGNESLDLAVANRGDDTVSILLNDGNGVFAVSATIPVGSLPSGIELADFGLGSSSVLADDLGVALEGDDEVLLLENDGGGGFIECCELPTGSAPASMPPEDLDNDKDVDLVVPTRGTEGAAGPTGNITLLLNEGDGVFTRMDLDVGINSTSADVEDLDGDGDIDLLVVAESEGQRSVRVLRNELMSLGELVFTVVADLAPDPSLELVLTSRLNDDASPDVIVIDGDDEESDGGVLVLLSFVCAADFSNDGIVGLNDLLILLAAWGPCPEEGECPEDLDGDGMVGMNDLMILLQAWGPCAS